MEIAKKKILDELKLAYKIQKQNFEMMNLDFPFRLSGMIMIME